MFLLLTAAIFYFLLGGIRIGPLYFVVAFPSVFMHEMAHLVTAAFMNGKPESMTLVPQKESDGTWTLGAVHFYPNWWNGGFVALAPLWVLPVFGWGLFHALSDLGVGHTILGGYILACVARGCVPSRADWEIAFRYPAGTFVILGTLAMLGNMAANHLGF